METGYNSPGAALRVLWVQGHAIGKGVDVYDFGVWYGFVFRDLGIKNE